MFRPRVIPVLLLKDKALVKTIRFKDSSYIGDPINAVKVFNDLKADELVFLDITASSDDRKTMINVVERVSQKVFIPLEK